MILIAGDSWACGEWTNGVVSHGGVAQYLKEQGHQVLNLGKSGGSNLESVARIADFLAVDNGFRLLVKFAIVFQTEWLRDALDLWNINEFRDLNYNYVELRTRVMSRFYVRLSETAMQTGVPIYVVGGCSDTIWLDRFESEYPGVHIACQSWVNLMISGDHRTDRPVFNQFGPHTESLVNYAKSKLDAKNLQVLLDDMDDTYDRDAGWAKLAKQGLCCDDGVHPNRHAHKQVFDYLLTVLPIPNAT